MLADKRLVCSLQFGQAGFPVAIVELVAMGLLQVIAQRHKRLDQFLVFGLVFLYPKANSLKPTQAEFSTKKAQKWSTVREGSDRSVLVSSDGHILDGHHQWVAALAANEPIQAIVLDAPIRELMTKGFSNY